METKTFFSVKILGTGTDTELLLKIIGNHNSGQVNINLDVIRSYILARNALYPNCILYSEDLLPCAIAVFEGKEQTLIIGEETPDNE